MSHNVPFRRLALTTSALALATALAAAPAAAQSFQGSASVTFGSATVTPGSGTTTVQVNSTSAVIDWTPTDNAISAGTPINFQPASTTATFRNDPTAQNQFAVLNRIVPADTSRPLVFNGTVLSRLQQASSLVPGGTVFFYSPGGIVLSPSAMFDVGNLGLTTAPPVVDGNGGWYTGNTVNFGQAPGSNSAVRIGAGAQISAGADSSYFAAFAPKVEQYGTVTVNGQAALVAGEAGSITFSPDGLFNISVSVGSDETFAIDHRGTTTGPVSSGTGDNHRVYMVAIPKNNAMQLAITRGSAVGFTVAGAANVQGNAVVLSAGRNVAAGQIVEALTGGTGEATISINDSNAFQTGTGVDFTSAVTARSSGRLFVDVFRQTRFASDASLRGDTSAQIGVSAIPNDSVGQLTVGGALMLSARAAQSNATGDAGQALMAVTNGASASITGDLSILAGTNVDRNGDGVALGGTAQVSLVSTGALTVGRDLIVDVSGFSDGAPGAPTAQGGNVQVNLTAGATLSVARVARINSYGIAGLGSGTGGQGRLGTGGSAILNIAGGSNFSTAELNIAADGVGGADVGGGGGRGVGGIATLTVSGTNSRATVTSPNVTGTFANGELDFMSAEGFGGQTAIANGAGGSAQGGTAAMSATAGGQITLPNSSATLRLIGRGAGGNVVAGTAGTGGAATGGTVSIFVDAATITGGALLPSSFAQGGSSTDPAVASSIINGGNAIGGTRNITVQNGATFGSAVTGGGPGGVGGNGSASGRGGDGTGGVATTVVNNATLDVATGNFLTFSQNVGGSGAVFGNASGGTATVTLSNNATVNVASGQRFSVTSGNLTQVAPFAGPAQSGGNVSTGTATMTIDNSRVIGSGIVDVSALGSVGHSAVAGGNASAGAARLNMTGSSLQANTLTVSADATGGALTAPSASISGANAGEATGGDAFAILQDSTINVGVLTVRANADAGSIDADLSTGGSAGNAVAGRAILQGAGGDSAVTAPLVRVNADANGGRVASGAGAGGSGTGGEARADVLASASLAINGELSATALGFGGNGNAGAGGAGIGGRAYTFTSGGTLTSNDDVFVNASATGGSGDGGGAATGGSAYVQSAAGGSTTITGFVDVRADASGGLNQQRAATGSAATSGSAQILATGGNAAMTINGTSSLSSVAAAGSGYRDAAGNGGPGGTAVSGLAEIGGNTGTGNVVFVTGSVDISANAFAGFGDASSGGNATGGRAWVSAGDSTSITVNGEVNARAEAYGGNMFDLNGFTAPVGSRGGDAGGGLALIQTFNTGGSVRIDGTTSLSSSAFGGSGDSSFEGGDATGGYAQVFTRNGAVSFGSDLFISSDFDGGSGLNGGDALANTGGFTDVAILAQNATVTVAGTTNAISTASGGSGREGGIGGSAQGGFTVIDANSNASGPSSITLNNVSIFSFAEGGEGGNGVGRAGGAGGAATGGGVQVFGTAGNGTLIITGSTFLQSAGIGGAGGESDTQAGGRGGDAFSNNVQAGTKSGGDIGPQNLGSATFADLTILTQAFGGVGGNSTSGAGGAGGDATSGPAVLLVRGTPVVAEAVSITAFGLGGSGGTGATIGAGGFGIGGNVTLTATNRFQRSERGSASIGTLTLNAIGEGGSGSTPGASHYARGGGILLTQSDATIGSLSYANTGTVAPPADANNPVLPVELTMVGSSLAVGSLAMITPGDFTLALDNSTVTADDFAITAGNFVLPAAPPAVPGTITVRDTLALTAGAGGAVRTYANFNAGLNSTFTSFDSIVLGNVATAGTLTATSQTGSVTVGSVDAVSANLTAQGNIQTGDIRVTQAFAAASTTGGVTTGTITAASASVSGQADVVTGNILTNGRTVVLSRAGSVTTGTVTAGSADLLAATSLTAGAIRTGGPLNLRAISGAISLGTIDATVIQFGAGTDFSASRIGATSIAGTAGGTLNVLGAWSSPSITLSANDIVISEGGALIGGANGIVNLVTANAQGGYIGDGLSGQGGFRLSSAEFGRISGNMIVIGARDLPNEVDMTIGTLSLSPAQLPGSDGSVAFVTGIRETSQPGGRIRVEGAVTGSGFSVEQYLSFTTGSFELNIDTGSIALAGNGPSGLGGIVEIDAVNIHIASPSILGRLRADPRYTGLANDLNRPATTQRLQGVLRAQGLEFYPGSTLYIQNTGTAASPAGFLSTPEESDIEPPGFENSSAPDVDVIINGRFATVNGEVTGSNALALIRDDDEASFDGLSAASQLNGCAFSGDVCASRVDESPALAAIASEFELLSAQTLAEEPFDFDEASEDEEAEAEKAASAPIEPPVILINTAPLNPSLDVADPVSGSGNPASLSVDPETTSSTAGAGENQ